MPALKPTDPEIVAIDTHLDYLAESLLGWHERLKEQMQQYIKETRVVYRRGTTYDTNRKPPSRDADSVELEALSVYTKHVRSCIEQMDRLETELGNLTRHKLRLLGDVDFSGGNDDVKRIMAARKNGK